MAIALAGRPVAEVADNDRIFAAHLAGERGANRLRYGRPHDVGEIIDAPRRVCAVSRELARAAQRFPFLGQKARHNLGRRQSQPEHYAQVAVIDVEQVRVLA